MSLTFRAAGATAAGGIATNVSQPLDPSIQVGDLIVWAVAAAENTRGWGGGIGNGGSVARFSDLSTDPMAVVLNGRSQYEQDDGVSTRRWLWLGYKIADVLDTGGASLTASMLSSPPFGVGIASAYAAYSNPGGSTPFGALGAYKQDSGVGGPSVTAPAVIGPGGSTGTFLYTVLSTSAGWRAAQTTVMFGDTGDYHVLGFAYGEGGTGTYGGPASLVDRVRWGGPGGPWYMFTWSDGPIGGLTNLGRLPLLGAG